MYNIYLQNTYLTQLKYYIEILQYNNDYIQNHYKQMVIDNIDYFQLVLLINL